MTRLVLGAVWRGVVWCSALSSSVVRKWGNGIGFVLGGSGVCVVFVWLFGCLFGTGLFGGFVLLVVGSSKGVGYV